MRCHPVPGGGTGEEAQSLWRATRDYDKVVERRGVLLPGSRTMPIAPGRHDAQPRKELVSAAHCCLDASESWDPSGRTRYCQDSEAAYRAAAVARDAAEGGA